MKILSPKHHEISKEKTLYEKIAENFSEWIRKLFSRESTSPEHTNIIKQLEKLGFKHFPKHYWEVNYGPKTVFVYPKEHQSAFEAVKKLINLPEAWRYYANDEVVLGHYDHERLDTQAISSKLSQSKEYDPIAWADCIYFYCNIEEYPAIESYFKKYGAKTIKVDFNYKKGEITFEQPLNIEHS